MVVLERSVMAGVITAVTLIGIRQAARRRWLRPALVLVAVMAVVLPALPASADGVANSDYYQEHAWGPSTDNKGHVAWTTNADCEWIQQTMATGDPQAPGEPYVQTVVTVDDGPNCSNTSFKAPAGMDSFRQDLYTYQVGWNGYGVDYLCNQGPRLVNSVTGHTASTTWEPQAYTHPPVCGDNYYQLNSFNYYNVAVGGAWDGGTTLAEFGGQSEMWVCANANSGC